MRPVLFALVLWSVVGIPAPAGEFQFVVIGDTRPRFESENFRPFERLIDRINTAHPAFVVNLGDLIYGYGPASKEKQWDKYEEVIRAIQAPYYQVPGNHDTHSMQARKVYGRRFGKLYQSFDYADCHFVLLDNTENEKWGYLGPAQLDWLKRDLAERRAQSVFVFFHFPVWEPERITPEYYEFWVQTLHPLFKRARVRAVFAGHYHAYGPTRELDGIRYFITGGGGAELRPEYRKSGGQYHFMKVRVSGDQLDVRVVTERGELSDPEADVMGGLQFAARHVSRIGIPRDDRQLMAGVNFIVTVRNPYKEQLRGEAVWLLDESAFSVEPRTSPLRIPVGESRQYSFGLKALRDTVSLASLPRLQFNVVSGGKRHRFHREVRFLQMAQAPYQAKGPLLDGELADWRELPQVKLVAGPQATGELRTCLDARNLYLALTVPAFDAAEAKESGFSDELQIGLSRRLGETDFGPDRLRLGFNSETQAVNDRTPGHKPGLTVPGARSFCRTREQRTTYEIQLPLRQLKGLGAAPGGRLVLDLSFPPPESGSTPKQPLEPEANSFSYRVRYGSDSLVPVYYVALDLQRRR